MAKLSRALVGTDAYLGLVNMETGEVDRLHEGDGPYVGISWDEDRVYVLGERDGEARVLAFDSEGKQVRDFKAGVTVGHDLIVYKGDVLVSGDGVVVQHTGKKRKKHRPSVFEPILLVLDRKDGSLVVVCADGAERHAYRVKDVADLPGASSTQIPDLVEDFAFSRGVAIILTSDGRYGQPGSQHPVVNSRAGGFAIYGATTIIGRWDPPSLVVIRRGVISRETYLPGASSTYIVRGVDVPDMAHLGLEGPRCPLTR